MKLLALIYLLLSALVVTLPTSVRAQETQETIVTREALTDEINQVRTTYRGQLEEYRNAERQYQIAGGQYAQLGTLAALEGAVVATRRAMVTRAAVLETYLTLLNLYMTDSTGINLQDKERSLTRLEATIAEVGNHRQEVEGANDRQAIMNVSQEFTPLASQVEDVAYEAQILLAIGRLQTVYDKTVAVSQEVRDGEAETGDLRQAERDRAYVEIQDSLQRVRNGIDAATPVVGERTRFSRNSFTTALRSLGEVYAGLSQSLSYVTELSRL